MRCRVAILLALALALPATACTPTGGPAEVPPPEDDEPVSLAPRVARPVQGRGPVTVEPDCGAIEIEPIGEWTSEGDRFERVREGWHPRAEHGHPVAVREARAPVSTPGFEIVEVWVDGAPNPVQPCFLARDTADDDGLSERECAQAWRLVPALPSERPQTNAQWAALVGLLDGASAVYSDSTQLDLCVSGLPARVRGSLPPLVLRAGAHEARATFVERIDVDARLTMLVTVSAVLQEGRLELEHQELWTIDREVAR